MVNDVAAVFVLLCRFVLSIVIYLLFFVAFQGCSVGLLIVVLSVLLSVVLLVLCEVPVGENFVQIIVKLNSFCFLVNSTEFMAPIDTIGC